MVRPSAMAERARSVASQEGAVRSPKHRRRNRGLVRQNRKSTARDRGSTLSLSMAPGKNSTNCWKGRILGMRRVQADMAHRVVEEVTELVARRVIELGRAGERDAEKLIARTLAEFGVGNDGWLWRH